jgi:glutamate N-acetyltransferase/amino-acid N-acetyltransferase
MAARNPQGFAGITASAGIKGDAEDFAVVSSTTPATVAAMFTQSRFAGPSVLLSQESARDGHARGVVVLSGNANVATGESGRADAEEVRARVAARLGLTADDLLIASTGVIGRPYPMASIRATLDTLPTPLPAADFDHTARAIMTTDTHPKRVSAGCGNAVITGIAKGVGMIEPNMATLLTFFFTDAEVPAAELKQVMRRVVERSFNALSVDTDTSTSDTAAVFANGLAGPVDLAEFEQALSTVALGLVRQIAADGEGASKLIEVRVTGARDTAQAKKVGKAIVNSPLVKTAVHGADPNWGRVAMAIGKCEDEHDIDANRVSIRFGEIELYPAAAGEDVLDEAGRYLLGDEVVIAVDLGIADGAFTVYGCDLTEGYIKINADYTT